MPSSYKPRDLLALWPPVPGGRKVLIRGVGMADVIFVALTVAIFVIMGFVVKAVERL